MRINNQFAIIAYVGSKPLNLMAKDTEIQNNPIKSKEWDILMEAVDTIYATQSIQNDAIPVFSTKRVNLLDNFNNNYTSYIPDTESSLRQLDSKSSYYIILRDTSRVPIKIPSHGQLVLGYSDASSLPYVSPPLADKVLDRSSFQYSFRPTITGLRPYESYLYSWKVISSNWPVVTNAISGELKPASSVGTINSTMAFCPTTGSCSNLTLPYTLHSQCSLEQRSDPYITLQLSIQSRSFDASESLSDQFTIICDDCLPKPRIDIQSLTPTTVVESTNDNAPIPSYAFRLKFNNLNLGENFSYTIETIKADWPIVFSVPLSGSFIANSINPPSIDGQFFFCPTSGLCNPNNVNIPNYTIPNYPKFLLDDIGYSVVIRASLNISGVCDSSLVFSDPVTITYKKI